MIQLPAVASEYAQIQANSRVLILDAAIESVLWVSEQCLHCLELSIQTLEQQTPADILGDSLYQALSEIDEHQPYHLTLEFQRQSAQQLLRFSVSVWRTADYLILEFEPIALQTEQRLLAKTNQWLSHLSQVTHSESVPRVLVDAVAELSGFDRVCLHKFDAEMNSMVIAEHCKQGIPSLKGLSFPASQMMCGFQQYLNQHIMICIDDVHSQPVKLIAVRQAEALPEPDQCLGLSWMPPASYLKMLKALDVKSVLVIAIFQDNKLWGSINCHSFTSKPLSSSIRDVSFNLVQMATQRLFLLTTQEQNLFQQRVMDSRQVLSDKRERLTEPAEMFADYAADWCELFCASGVVLVFDDDVFRHGNSPANQPLEKIISGLGEQKKACFYTESLGNLFPEIAEQLVDCCGLLAISLPYDHHRPGWLLLFRPEATIEFKWAVKPEHLTEKNASQSEQSSYWSEIVRGESQPWTPIERQAAMDLGEDLAVVIAVHQISKLNQRFSETNQRLEQLAHTDTLTQIWNRYRMELAIDAEVAASSRYGRPCSLLLFDIDHFKQINDNFGHDVGDAVLAGIAWEVKTLLRASDHLGRWGGEEFIVLASNTDLAEAEKLAERLCRHIYALELETVGRISVSIGVTEWQTGDMRRDIVERADKAMYEAKQTGRNRWLSDRKR